MTGADKWIREQAEPFEVGTVIVEDCNKMNTVLQTAFNEQRNGSTNLSRAEVNMTTKETELGYITQETETRITRLRQTVHFVRKGGDPLLQIADACAFGIRRYYSQLPHGDTMIEAIVGEKPPIENVLTAGEARMIWGPLVSVPKLFLHE